MWRKLEIGCFCAVMREDNGRKEGERHDGEDDLMIYIPWDRWDIDGTGYI